MLKINLLFSRLHAEKAYKRWRHGAPATFVDFLGDHIVMQIVSVVRRRMRQDLRRDKKKAEQRARQSMRRAGISWNRTLNRYQGKPCGVVGKPKPAGKYRKEYMTNLVLIKHTNNHEPDKQVQPKFTMVTPEDVDWAERQQSARKLRTSSTIKVSEKTPANVKGPAWKGHRVRTL